MIRLNRRIDGRFRPVFSDADFSVRLGTESSREAHGIHRTRCYRCTCGDDDDAQRLAEDNLRGRYGRSLCRSRVLPVQNALDPRASFTSRRASLVWRLSSKGGPVRQDLHDGQVFVALDTCNGGIGFGAFLGPNGLEPAYPLAFTLGTAEYAAIIDLSPLTAVCGHYRVCLVMHWLSAWAAPITLPGTPTGNCIPPDTYPLKSRHRRYLRIPTLL